jgi:NAD(P)H dehydrogenase (quinone)
MSADIVVVFHSGYGHTAKVAEAVAAGSDGHLLA